MIVRQDQGGGIQLECPLQYGPRVHGRPIYGAQKQALTGDQLMPAVQKQPEEHLPWRPRKLQAQIPPNGFGAGEQRSFTKSLLRPPLSKEHCRFQLRDPSRLRPWLYAIARNECTRHGRARDRAVPVDDTVIRDHPDAVISIVAELPGDGKKDQGFKCTEDALQAHANLAGIFAINDPSALGARAALEKAGKADDVVIVGFDGQLDGRQAILEGKIYADPVQFPDRIAAMTVDSIVRYFAGDEVATQQLIPCELYRQAEAEADESLK